MKRIHVRGGGEKHVAAEKPRTFLGFRSINNVGSWVGMHVQRQNN